MRKEYLIDDFYILHSGFARQIVMICHGGYQHKYGYVKVPKKMRLHFYTLHTEFATSGGFVGEILRAGKKAYLGWKYPDVRENPQFKKALNLYEKMEEGEFTRATAQRKLEDLFSRQLQSSKIGVKYTVGAYKNGKNKNFEVPTYNYGLSPDANYNGTVYKQCKKGSYSPDIDFMVMDPNPKKKRYLKDALKAAAAANNYREYEVFHCLCCRVLMGQEKRNPPGLVSCYFSLSVEQKWVNDVWINFITHGLPVSLGTKFYGSSDKAALATKTKGKIDELQMVVRVLINVSEFREKKSKLGSIFEAKKQYMHINKRFIISYKLRKQEKWRPGKLNFSTSKYILIEEI